MTVSAKIYGLFRSGTNLTKLLTETHLDAKVAVNNGGNKHLTSPVDWSRNGYVASRKKFIVCVKDPYAAMTSLHDYACSLKFRHFDCAQNWDRFLDERFIIKIKHPSNPPALYYSSPIDYWNAFHYHFLSFDRNVLFVRYEDVLADPAAAVTRIGEFLGARRTSTATPALPERRVVKMGETTRDNPLADEEFDPNWYLNREFLKRFGPSQAAAMRDRLDPDVVGRLGYAIEPEAHAT